MFILLIIVSCIYKEFIVINICGLSEDTKLFLEFKEGQGKILAHKESLDDINRLDSVDSVKSGLSSLSRNSSQDVEMAAIN